MTPNLFNYATSELTQDAFLCWLLAWADPTHADADPMLHEVAVAFVGALFDRAGLEAPTRARVEVLRQVRRVDVVALVGDQHVLLIEDKTDTSNHSNQLDRYRAALADKYNRRTLVCIYLKSGDQSSYADVEAKGWAVFRRTDLLGVLRRGSKVRNEVFRQFADHIEEIERSVQAYRSTPFDGWDRRAWSGFYMALQESLGSGGWGYVANPSGGFMGFWWGWMALDHGDKLYLQLEQDRLVVKVEVADEDRRGRVRDHWRDRVLSALPEFERPKRMGRGRWMTVAVFRGDYRLADQGGVFDRGGTTATLRRLEKAVIEIVAPLRS